MQNKNRIKKIARFFTGGLLALIGLNAFGGGYYGMMNDKNLPLIWLKDSPFHSYFLPSLFLFIVIGFSCTISSLLVFIKNNKADKAVLFCGILLLSWIIIQLVIIGFVSWLQPLILISGIILISLSKNLK